MSNIDLFINKKRNNFVEFLLEYFPDNEPLKKDIDKYKYVSIPDFIFYIKEELEPYKDKFEIFIDEKIKKYKKVYQIPEMNEKSKQKFKEKFKKYLEFFYEISKMF